MPIEFNPGVGCIVTCNFDQGFKPPEMVKRRPVIIITPPISMRPKLCTVVPLSTTVPEKIMPYNMEIELPFVMPPPFSAQRVWIKGDMINAVGFHRLDLIRSTKDINGKRQYYTKPVGQDIMIEVYKCVLHGLSLSRLTKALT